MADELPGGDEITVGDITGSQGVAIGRNAQTRVTGHNVSGDVRIDSGQLRSALEELYDALGDAELSRNQRIDVQTATGNALKGVTADSVDSDTVTSNLEKVGDTLRQANVAIGEGTAIGENIGRLATLLGPLVGGARIVAGWFGIPL
jgi:propanediol dehydratase small subunit